MKNWTLERDADGIAWATINCPERAANALSANVLEELGQLLDQLDQQAPKALIIRSGKDAGFVAGADIDEFSGLDTPEKGRNLVARGWNLFNRLAAVRYPTLALVRGHCLGGGLELALACRYRIVVDEPGTRLGLPEVMLGIFPGWGGMKRLPELTGPQVALDMMLTGKTVDAKKAKRLGIADLCVAPRIMVAAAKQTVLSGRAPVKATGMKALMNSGLMRGFIASQAKKQVARKADPRHYPAPYAILDIWAKHGGNALETQGLIEGITQSNTARNLVRVFHLQERLKSFGKDAKGDIRHVHVVGAGTMGADIAAWCVQRGLTVSLQDQSLERIASAIGRLKTGFERRYKDKLELRSAFDRLIPDVKGEGAGRADVVIEAIFEDLDAKRSLLQSLEARMKPDAVLASNTSSLRIEDLREGLKNPARLVGIHFFNPVAKMPLVEVVEATNCDAAALARAYAFVRKIDKLPLPVKSAPGFLVNAVLAPYMLEAMRAMDEGLSAETIDRALRDFGMPLGPIELADTVGLDIALAAGKQLAGVAQPPACLLQRIQAGQLGRKTGQGFYAYPNGSMQRGSASSAPAGLAARLVKPLIERTQQLVIDGIVADADLADAGVIFGTGFAPFTGGPLHYQNSQEVSGLKHSSQGERRAA
ncbi:MAG TPA: 3-hydroxyacyl-CoA dehydrogenase NAD-binding domain-containing protein [Rhodocyclaceae bacterium]|nr:3-hydroxyacyl-CoA dehydrogenase NAD-binding domain-containing protein [Rhodocyclaceae bacterium]